VTPAYVLTQGAEADLRDIIRYTAEQWGAEQCGIYVAALEAKALARGHGAFRELSDLLPGLRMGVSGKHLIFCLPRPEAPAIILAILHERMDMITRLKSRLGV